MPVEAVLRILYPGVKGLLNQKQASNLVISLILLALEPIDVDTLKFLARFFTPTDYDELVQERALLPICGYPTCANQLKTHQGTPRQPSVLSAFPWSKQFCSRHCFVASSFYRKQLSTEVLVTRRDVAYASYGTLGYENKILVLEQVEHYATKHSIDITEAIRELISTDLTSSIQQLAIDIPIPQEMQMPIIEHPESSVKPHHTTDGPEIPQQ